ncbi:hypothetical protein ABOM_012117 [Aspergillus bombycis]|uniref:Aminoglycoside phosphotransferase domain-containing protein n=1 Tax=Aspergillus bombycis TaxID=109264 RepID=A0A1F7ZJD6_9EURO|nr:hypothetical protein ABOM_012117 [Aspergillus bombycis]OGM39419.1 hypothetical protein ABOM_012117 [Aspergillus bombycis]
MDNGAEVFAKLPNPNAGPTGYTTASEVATHELLRDVFNIPVPRILAWSFDAATNPVEAEYIVTEKAPGVRLGSVWSQWSQEAKLKLIRQIVDIEDRLTTISFPRHGCIYFKDDLRSLAGYAEDIKIESAATESLERFSIGPLTSSELWEGTRRNMRLDRGPWCDPQEYTQALGRNEIAWIESHACPRMNYYRSDKEQEFPGDGLALLAKYMKVAPYLIPSPIHEAATSKVIWHPDLHLDNVFVDPDTYEITCIVDWQSACVAPLFYQSGVPRMFRHPGPVREGWVVPERPEHFDTLSEDEKRTVDNDLESETIHKYYEAQVCKRAPSHWSVLHGSSIPILRKPVWLVSGVWQNRDLFFLRQSLLSLATHWHEIFAEDQLPCPIEFTDEEINLHSKEENNIDGVGRILALFRDQGVLPIDGMVDPEDYEITSQNSRKFKDIFIGLAKDEAERELYTKLWPYQMPSYASNPSSLRTLSDPTKSVTTRSGVRLPVLSLATRWLFAPHPTFYHHPKFQSSSSLEEDTAIELTMQSDEGFVIVPGDEPSDDLIQAVTEEVSHNEHSSPKGCGPKCHELMGYGVKLPEEAWFQTYLGCSYSSARKIGDTRVMTFNKNRIGRFVPGPPGTVLVYRAATRAGLYPENGFFKIVPRSHRMTAGEIKRAESKTLKLRPRDVLFFVANLTIEYVTSGEGIALCEAVSSSLKSE